MPILLDVSQSIECVDAAEVIRAVDRVASALNIPWMIVGAFARDLPLKYGREVRQMRRTLDVDLGFAVENWREFESLRTGLSGNAAFVEHGRIFYRLTHRQTSMTIDLIPFGGVEDVDRTVALPPDGGFVMEMFGFREALESADQVLLPGNVHATVVSLPALALLKIIAWNDRHVRTPRKDAEDLNVIVRNYLTDRNQERLFAEFEAWTSEPQFDLDHAMARMLGHDIATLVHSDAGKRRVLDILRRETNDEIPGILAAEMNFHGTDFARSLLKSLHRGFAETNPVDREH